MAEASPSAAPDQQTTAARSQRPAVSAHTGPSTSTNRRGQAPQLHNAPLVVESAQETQASRSLASQHRNIPSAVKPAPATQESRSLTSEGHNILPSIEPTVGARGSRTRSASESSLSSVPSSDDDEPNNPEVAPRLHSGMTHNVDPPEDSRGLRLYTESESGLSENSEFKYEEDSEDEDAGWDSEDEVDDDVKEESASEDFDRETRRQEKSRKVSSPERKAPKQRDPNAPKISNLTKKKQNAMALGHDVDEMGIRKGRVRTTPNGDLQYYNIDKWVDAIYHTQIREECLTGKDEDGSYDEAPAQGHHRLDRTSFHDDQEHWIFSDRKKRPGILFVWSDPQDGPTYKPYIWYYGDFIVLDTKNKPIKLWEELPLTISGQCEGYRMETWRRLNPRIKMNDIRARMPERTCKGPGKANKTIQVPMLANRMSNSRVRFGLKSWEAKQGSEIKAFRLLEIMDERSQRELVHTNSTRRWRDLTDAEFAYVELGNKGTAASLAKAGPRQLSETARQKYVQKKNRSREKAASTVETYDVIKEALPTIVAAEPKQKKWKKRKTSDTRAESAAAEEPAGDVAEEGIMEGEAGGEKREGDEEYHNELARDLLGGLPGGVEGGQEAEPAQLGGHINIPTNEPAPPNFLARQHGLNNFPLVANNNLAAPPINHVRTYIDARREQYDSILRREAQQAIDAAAHDAQPHELQMQPLLIPGSSFHPPGDIDYRTVKPRNQAEFTYIQMALELSRNDYVRLMGHDAPLPLNPEDVYES
ncbi:MAG: hypothetical protein Q9168_003608, partial [Polycauliona sp. 1 TL-2023]